LSRLARSAIVSPPEKKPPPPPPPEALEKEELLKERGAETGALANLLCGDDDDDDELIGLEKLVALWILLLLADLSGGGTAVAFAVMALGCACCWLQLLLLWYDNGELGNGTVTTNNESVLSNFAQRYSTNR
jgi:hypothetical protein